jgi:cytochrome b
MPRTLIYDLPVRLFHWLLAAGFTAAAVIALLLGEHHRLFPYHAVIGLVLAGLVVLRLLWGVAGTRHARFASLAHSPAALAAYFGGVLFGGGRRYAAHNPASAYATIAMFALVVGLAATGVMMGRGNEAVKDVHEIMAYALAAVAAVHILGVALHTVRHKEAISLSMVHGRRDADPSAGIPSARPGVALALLLITAAGAAALLGAYDQASQALRVPMLGTLQIGDADGAHDNAEDDD